MFKLYYTPGTCALASHITLAEAGAGYTTERIDIKTNQQNSAEYLAINPKGRVQALVTDRGTLTETPAMLAFIAQSFPEAKLAPFDDLYALHRCSRSTAICVPRCTSTMPTRCVGRAGRPRSLPLPT